MTLAITREVSSAIVRCELTHLEREPIDLARARAEHAAYRGALAELGCDVRTLPEEPELADSVFVEDAAIVLDEIAVLTRPGAASRRPEVDSIAAALQEFRPLARVEAPCTLDGGDVLVLGRDVHVGLSSRSDARSVAELERLIGAHGYRVHGVPIQGCLHLKSAACAVAEDTVLVNPEWVDARRLGARAVLEVDPAEPFAANAVLVGEALVHAHAFPRTRARLEARGLRVVPVPAAELAKAEGGVTCCSLLVGERP